MCVRGSPALPSPPGSISPHVRLPPQRKDRLQGSQVEAGWQEGSAATPTPTASAFPSPMSRRRPEQGKGLGEACGGSRQLCLPFPSLHPFVRRSVFLLLKGSEGEKSRRGLGLSGHSCSTLEFFSLEDPQQIETTERTLQHCHPRQNQDLAPQSGSAATWPCDTGPVPRPSADNNPIISTTCCSSNSYHEPGAACFI